MLTGPPADTDGVIHRVLAAISLVCCVLVFASFALFARDQVAGASKHQQSELVGTAVQPPGAAKLKVKPVGQPRRFIDGAAGKLTSPFDSFVHSDNAWVKHGVPAALALLVYGLGLGILGRFAQGGARLPTPRP